MDLWQLPWQLIVWCLVCAAMLGAVLGSFLHCAAWRIVRGESFVAGRSRCPACGATLQIRDLVPIFSYLFLKGRCRRCGARIPVRYLLCEVFFALVTAACPAVFGLGALCLRNWLFLCCLFLLSLVDLEKSEIPDGCLIAAALVWLVFQPFLWRGWADAGLHLLAAAVYGGGLLLVALAMDRLLKKESMGGGDVKLLAVIGLYLGLAPTLFCVILACVLGLLQMKLTCRTGGPMPFGPALAASAAVMLAVGEPLATWYLGLF